MKHFYLITLFLLQYCITKAGYGYTSDCSVTIELNNKKLSLGNCSNSTYPSFDSYNFGSIGALTINSLQQITYENGVHNVTKATMYYRIYSGTATTNFNAINLTSITSLPNGEEKREATPSQDLLFNLITNTNYTLEIYFESELSTGEIFKYNNINFKANFKTPVLLPLKMNSFTVSTANNSNILKWVTVSENDLRNFIILRSNNGNNWVEIGNTIAMNLANGSNYSFIDNSPFNGNNFYRIISVNLNGEKTYSSIIRNFFGKIDNSLSLYPNPTVDYLKVNFVSNIRGQYYLDMYNDAGQRLHQQTFTHNGSDRTISIDLPKSMKKGPYRIHISNGSDFYIGTFIVQ